MAVETRRGCGWRKAGGLYLVGDFGNPVSVPWLPFCTDYDQVRALTWADTVRLFRTVPATDRDAHFNAHASLERVALLWVGSRHYSPDTFAKEALGMGVSKRVASIPQGLKVGDPIMLAHPSAIPVSEKAAAVPLSEITAGTSLSASAFLPRTNHCPACRYVPQAKVLANALIGARRQRVRNFSSMEEPALCLHFGCGSYRIAGTYHCADHTPMVPVSPTSDQLVAEPCLIDPTVIRFIAGHGDPLHVAGVFGGFRMRAVELVLPASVATDPSIRAKCEERGVTIVAVPDGDTDHVPPNWKLPAFLRGDDSDQLIPGDADEDAAGESAAALQAAPAQGRLF